LTLLFVISELLWSWKMNESKDVSLDAMLAYPDWQAET